MHRVPPKFLWFLALTPMLFGFDLASKQAVERSLPVGGEIEVVSGVVSVFHAQNPYIAFSLPVPLVVIGIGGIVALGAIAITLWRLPEGDRGRAIALASVTAGALGNLVDRLGDGMVTDFVKLSWGTATWPIFNVADVAILAGVALWAGQDLLDRDQPPGSSDTSTRSVTG